MASEAEGKFGASVPVVPSVGERRVVGEPRYLTVYLDHDVMIVVQLPANKISDAVGSDVGVPDVLGTFAEARALRSGCTVIVYPCCAVGHQVVVRYAK